MTGRRGNGYALKRAVPGRATRRLLARQQETEDEIVERGEEADEAQPQGVDPETEPDTGGGGAQAKAGAQSQVRSGGESTAGQNLGIVRLSLWAAAGGRAAGAGGE